MSVVVEFSWNVMAHGDVREGKWKGNWRMEWVSITLTLPRNMVYPALPPLIRTPRLPVAELTDAPADLNGLVRFAERRNPVSARVPSHLKLSPPPPPPTPTPTPTPSFLGRTSDCARCTDVIDCVKCFYCLLFTNCLRSLYLKLSQILLCVLSI